MKNIIETNNTYHVLNKSIAGYEIFNSEEDYLRIIRAMRFFSLDGSLPKFSQFLNFKKVERVGFENALEERSKEEPIVDIIAYCIMPTHFHFVLKQNKDQGISEFVGNLSNSYSRYFNSRYSRRGPLWQGRFKRVKVDSDEQLRHLTRYLHLNPVSAGLVKDPSEWRCSSYCEFVEPEIIDNPICNYEGVLDINPEKYKEFVLSRADYQRDLEVIKKRVLE